ncbi:MAG: hypothetical protein RR192_04425 [Peptostreptococcaceae bacterium]
MKIKRKDGRKMTPEEIERHITNLLECAIWDQKALNTNQKGVSDWNKAVDRVIERLDKMKKAPVTNQSEQELKK